MVVFKWCCAPIVEAHRTCEDIHTVVLFVWYFFFCLPWDTFQLNLFSGQCE